ncbi:hypothetical protein DRQ33_01120, partial [bacterium]
LLWVIISPVIAQVPERSGIALGYMTTPNSIVYRNSWSENNAIDLWIDIPNILLGDMDGFEMGAGTGFAMFFNKQRHFCFMIRPQISLRYIANGSSYSELGIGIAGSAVAYMDSLGVPNTDIYAGISLGSIARFNEDFNSFTLILTQERPFGILIGVMKYF